MSQSTKTVCDNCKKEEVVTGVTLGWIRIASQATALGYSNMASYSVLIRLSTKDGFQSKNISGLDFCCFNCFKEWLSK